MYKKVYRKLAGRGLSRFFPNNYFAKRAVRNMTGDVRANVHDFEMIVPIKEPYGYILYLKHVYEPAVTKFIQSFLTKGQTFVDVGACLGYYSLLASSIVGPKGRVLAFEPDLNNFSYAYDNIMINDFTENIHLLEAAASDKKGKANLNISANHIGCHSLLYSEILGHTDSAAIVDTIPVDKCIDSVDMVKIDVDGWEYYVLKGMESFFSRNDNIIIFLEHCMSLMKGNEKMAALLFNFLEHYALDIAIIDEKKKKLKYIDSVDKLKQIKERVNLVWWS